MFTPLFRVAGLAMLGENLLSSAEDRSCKGAGQTIRSEHRRFSFIRFTALRLLEVEYLNLDLIHPGARDDPSTPAWIFFETECHAPEE